MRRVFADAGYWIALHYREDALHSVALATTNGLGAHHIVTSEFVLLEYLNFFASRGSHVRSLASDFARKLRQSQDTEVVAAKTDLFAAALEFYSERSDKSWGFTDCSSFIIMHERGISEALSHDRHFEQAGFVARLRAR